MVIINRGKRQGLEPGQVLSIWEGGDHVIDRGRGGLTHSNQFTAPFAPTIRLPSERAGTFMVFRAYDDMSYGLVLNATTELHVGDSIRNP